MQSPSEYLDLCGQNARRAAYFLAKTSEEQKNKALEAIVKHLKAEQENILASNALDYAEAKAKGVSDAILDRLLLNLSRFSALCFSLAEIIAQPQPVEKTLDMWTRPNGLIIEKISVPLGVIGVIYEARPNVTLDAAALCLKSGNAVILRSGSASFRTAKAIVNAIQAALKEEQFPSACVQLIEHTDRSYVDALLALDKWVDVIVPRGGRDLIESVMQKSRIPVFKHLDGICHTYLHEEVDPAMAVSIVLNAKMRRTGICGATETLLIDKSIVETIGKTVVDALLKAGCELRGDEAICALDKRILKAQESDWRAEYLAPILSIKAVSGLAEAVEHINYYGSHHTDAILTGSQKVAELFLKSVDSAIVLHNASTQFADGGEFGFGAEMGIATGKLHARGPVGLAQLTTFQYRVRGAGQIRPV